LTNKGERAVSIFFYSVLVKTDRGWQRLAPLSYAADEPGSVVVVVAKQWIKNLDVTEVGFDYKAKRTTLSPGSTLSGWMFFRTRPLGEVNSYRFEFVDSANAVHNVSYSTSTESQQKDFASLQSAYFPLGP